MRAPPMAGPEQDRSMKHKVVKTRGIEKIFIESLDPLKRRC